MFAIIVLQKQYKHGRNLSMDSFILCGMQFGDEGKGTFVDYLAHEQNIDCVVRYYLAIWQNLKDLCQVVK